LQVVHWDYSHQDVMEDVDAHLEEGELLRGVEGNENEGGVDLALALDSYEKAVIPNQIGQQHEEEVLHTVGGTFLLWLFHTVQLCTALEIPCVQSLGHTQEEEGQEAAFLDNSEKMDAFHDETVVEALPTRWLVLQHSDTFYPLVESLSYYCLPWKMPWWMFTRSEYM
jgi:hypothetical protein